MEVILQRPTDIPELQEIGMLRFLSASSPMEREVHENAFELLYLRSGVKPFGVGDQDLALFGGDLLIIPPNQEHGQSSIQNRSSLYYLLVTQPEQCPIFLGLGKEERTFLQSTLMHADHPIRLPRFAQQAIEQLFMVARESSPLRSALLRAHLTLLMQGIVQFCGQSRRALPADMAAIITYLDQCGSDTISIAQLASQAGLSEAWFKQKFKQTIGIPPAEYCLRRKLETATKELCCSTHSMTKIAMLLGFSSSQHFSATFRHYLGCTPSEYRRLHTTSSSKEDQV